MEEELEQVYLAQGVVEAEIIKGKLESNDIPVLLRYESASVVYGLTIGTLGEVHVLVPAHLAAQARELLTEDDAIGTSEDAPSDEDAPEA
jgi:hypothetical protein